MFVEIKGKGGVLRKLEKKVQISRKGRSIGPAQHIKYIKLALLLSMICRAVACKSAFYTRKTGYFV